MLKMRRVLTFLVLTAPAMHLASPAVAQVNPVYVDNSPHAWELLRLAEDQERDNLTEAARLYQRLLDEFGSRLVPSRPGPTDHFVAVRERVLQALRSNDALLERYQLIASAEAERMLGAGELTELAQTRALTPPGLEALLRLGQAALERGSFHAADHWITEALDHPSANDRQAAHAWYMYGAISHLLGRHDDAQRALMMLRGFAGRIEELIAALEQLQAQTREAPDFDAVNVMSVTSTDAFTDVVAEPIWSAKLEDTLSQRRAESQPMRFSPDFRTRENTELNTLSPALRDGIVYINEGYRVSAYDRYTGALLWQYKDTYGARGFDQRFDAPVDLNLIDLAGSRLVTLMGYTNPAERTVGGRVVCLDARTGELLWQQEIDDLLNSDDVDTLYPYGAPVIIDDLVCVLGRKVSRELLTSTFVIGLDLESGGLRWSQHISSSGAVRRSSRPYSSMISEEGALFVAESTGAIARLDPVTGVIRWLRRFDVPISFVIQDMLRRPWSFSTPVVTSRGVLAVEPSQRRVVLLDVQTGDDIASYDASVSNGWRDPHYLLAVGNMVYGIGNEIRAFSIDDLSKPLWQLPPPAQSLVSGAPQDPRPFRLAGRVQAVGSGLVIPLEDSVRFVDGETGATVNELAIERPGNILVAGAQLFVASSMLLETYMPFMQAEAMLRERVASHPSDAQPALALLRLGLVADRFDLALEGAERALAAIELRGAERGEETPFDPARNELFDLLLRVDATNLASIAEEGDALHGLIGRVAVTTEQRGEHLLAYGAWLAESQPKRAIDVYQRIFVSDELRDHPRRLGDITRPLAWWTAQRVQRMLDRHGRDVYAAPASAARREMQSVDALPSPDPEPWVRIARTYPFAEVAPRAAQQAATKLAQQGAIGQAAAVLHDLAELARPVEAANLLIAEAELLQADGEAEAAAALLREVRRRFGAGVDQSQLDALLAGLPAPDAPMDLPQLDSIGERARVIDGRVIPVRHESAAPLSSALVLVIHQTTLTAYDAPALTVKWSVNIGDAQPELLRFNEAGTLLWLRDDAADPRAMMLDPETGALRWMMESISDRLPQVGRMSGLTGTRSERRGSVSFDPAEIVPILTNDTLVAARRSGGAVAYSLVDGSVLWAQPTTLMQLHHTAQWANRLALAGYGEVRVSEGGSTGPAPMIALFDLATGEIDRRIELSSSGEAEWLHIDPLGTLLYGNANGVTGLDVFTGAVRWSNRFTAIAAGRFGAARGEDIIMIDDTDTLRRIDAWTGDVSASFAELDRADWEPGSQKKVFIAGDDIYSFSERRLIKHNARGEVIGADAVADSHDYRWFMLTRGGWILVSALSPVQLRVEETGARRTQYVYRIYRLSENGRLLEDVQTEELLRPVQQVSAANGWLLLGTDDQTLAIPMQANASTE